MSHLPALLELQRIHEHLRTIQRDLTAFPPDLAQLDAERQRLAQHLEQLQRACAEARSCKAEREAAFQAAERQASQAREAVKRTQHKVHYAAAIRELDEHERERTAALRPLQAITSKLEALEAERVDTEEKHARVLAQFQELHAVFLDEHANQVSVRERLLARRQELEAQLPPPERTRFERLIELRQGRAIVPIEQGGCSGCHTKLRAALLALAREGKLITCEACQRYLHWPEHP